MKRLEISIEGYEVKDLLAALELLKSRIENTSAEYAIIELPNDTVHVEWTFSEYNENSDLKNKGDV